MAALTEFYCRSNETSHASQFKWLDYTFKFETLKPPNLDLLQVEQHVDQIVLEEAGRSSQLNDQVFGIRSLPGIGTNTFLAWFKNVEIKQSFQ
jgi:hypothetical protein